MSTELVWGLPPKATGRKGGQVAEFVEQLKARPGEWALYPHTRSAPLITVYRRTYPGTEWASRNSSGKSKADIYGRWVGES